MEVKHELLYCIIYMGISEGLAHSKQLIRLEKKKKITIGQVLSQ